MAFFKKDVQKIVDAHAGDFDCRNCAAALKAAGGYRAYVKSLGGVFARYLDYKGPVRTMAEYHDVCDYVFGLFCIYGYDYNNGARYVRWEGRYPYYVNGAKGICNAGEIDDLCGNNAKSKTTCCNWAIDTLLKKMGWLPNGQQTYCTQASFGELITKKSDLRPGDIVHFYRDPNGVFNAHDPSTYRRSGWHHVVIVYDITPDSIIMADGGSRMQYGGGQWQYKVPKTGLAMGGTYGTSDKWLARRIRHMDTEEIYRVRRSWDDPGSQIGAYKVLDNAKQAVEQAHERGETYTVYNSAGVPVWPFYRVRRSWEDAESQLGAYTYYRNAEYMSNLVYGYNVYDSWGKELHTHTQPALPIQVQTRAGAVIYGWPGEAATGTIKGPGIYTITDVATADMRTYGRLKSGAGWIDLSKVSRPET